MTRVRRGLVIAWTAACGAACADEGGVAFWLSGQYASLAAVPPAPGGSLPATFYGYGGRASDTALVRGNALVSGLDSGEVLLLLQPNWTPEAKVLGGRLSLGLGFGIGWNGASSDVSISGAGAELGRSDTDLGATDLSPVASLSWGEGVHNWMSYLTGNLPVGSYDSARLANIGIGHGAIDAGGGYTYLDATTGREFSAVLGVTWNSQNPATNYRNGIDSHLDWGASKFVTSAWEIGLAGYVYYQLTGDNGSGARLGPFKSKVAAIGPQIGYQFTTGGQQAYASLRGYWEFWAENRLQGRALFATLEWPLGGR